jgi:hypothetical protein
MDILNFISWIRGGRIVTTVDPNKTLIPVGLKDGRRDDEYLAGAISVTDLAAQIGGGGGGGLDIETITVDMNVNALSISTNGPSNIGYIFSGFDTFLHTKSSIISLSDGSYLVGPKQNVVVPA